MAEALRSLLADFQVRVDPEGNLRKGNLQVDALKAKFQGLGPTISASTSRIGGAFAGLRNSLNGGFGGGAPGGGLLKGLFSLQNSLAALAGGFALNSLVGIVDQIGGIGEQAAKLGVTNAEFQRLDVLAKQNATSVQALGTAFRNLANAAVQPTKETTAAFARLGVETRNSDGSFRARQDLFFDTASALADMSDSTQRAALAQDVFGRSAIEILPLLSNGRKGIEEQRAALERLAVVSDSAIKAADEFSDSLPALKLELMALAGPVLEQIVVPALAVLRDVVLSVAKGFEFLTKRMNPAAVGFAALAIGLTPLVSQLRLLIALGGGWRVAAANMGKACVGLLRTVAPLVAAFLLLEDIFVFFTGGKSLTGQGLEKAFGPGVKKTVDDLREAFKDLWKWILGDGAGEKFKSLMSEIGQALKLMIHDALSLVPGSGRTAGLAGLEAFESRQAEMQARGEISIPAKVLGGVSENDPFMKSLLEVANRRTVGDTSVTIVNPPPGQGLQMAGQVKGVLDRSQAAVLGTVQ
jgi:hypothetical protein